MRPRQATPGIHYSRVVLLSITSTTQKTQTYRESSQKQKYSSSPPRMLEKNRWNLKASEKPERIWIELGQVCAQVRNLCVKMIENVATKTFLSSSQVPTPRESNTVFNYILRKRYFLWNSDATKKEGIDVCDSLSVFIFCAISKSYLP